jgi:predicted nucleic acid-binding protein
VKNTERVACDAGPIIALINRRDPYHSSCKTAAEGLGFPLFTVWPVVVEAYYVIESHNGPADRVLHWLTAGHLRLIDLRETEIRRMRQIIRKYSDLPMDLADAALVAACERMKIRRVFTVDKRDFMVYRPAHVSSFDILP